MTPEDLFSLMRQHTDKPWLIDAFCCQGGASAGYVLAGFYVAGVDTSPEMLKRYPYPSVRVDAVQFLREHGHRFAVRHTSPPCQHDSDTQRIQGNDHPDLIGPTRDALLESGGPYVIENVVSASTREKLKDPGMLCGEMFGLKTYRHRLFETSHPVLYPVDPPHPQPTVKMGRKVEPGQYYHAVGNFSGVAYARRDMGVGWMNRDGVRECIPPIYARYVGEQIKAQL